MEPSRGGDRRLAQARAILSQHDRGTLLTLLVEELAAGNDSQWAGTSSMDGQLVAARDAIVEAVASGAVDVGDSEAMGRLFDRTVAPAVKRREAVLVREMTDTFRRELGRQMKVQGTEITTLKQERRRSVMEIEELKVSVEQRLAKADAERETYTAEVMKLRVMKRRSTMTGDAASAAKLDTLIDSFGPAPSSRAGKKREERASFSATSAASAAALSSAASSRKSSAVRFEGTESPATKGNVRAPTPSEQLHHLLDASQGRPVDGGEYHSEYAEPGSVLTSTPADASRQRRRRHSIEMKADTLERKVAKRGAVIERQDAEI